MIHIYIDGNSVYEYTADELEDIIATTPAIASNRVLRKYMNIILERRKQRRDEEEEEGEEEEGMEEEEERKVEISKEGVR